MELASGTKIRGVLVFVVWNGTVILAKKKKQIGVGYWNGYGGSIENGETEREAAIRELHEETGLSIELEPDDLDHMATINFHNETADGSKCVVQVYVFTLECPINLNRIEETPEMGPPQEFPFGNLPSELMPADPEWLPRVLRGEHLYGEVFYTRGQQGLAKPSVWRPLRTRERK